MHSDAPPGDVAALELNQVGRRRGSPYFAISASARSARAHAASNGGWQHKGGKGVVRAAARCVLTVSRPCCCAAVIDIHLSLGGGVIRCSYSWLFVAKGRRGL